MIKFLKRLFNKERHGAEHRVSQLIDNNKSEDSDMKKVLVVGLGNIGKEYEETRHNLGFMAADRIAEINNGTFASCRYGDMAKFNIKNCRVMLLKPSTFMNLSGVAIRYWMNKEKIELQNLLVIVDDIALPFGTIRMRAGGSDAGHNGLKNIAEQLGTNRYARLRFGIGSNFATGSQVNYVLGDFDSEERGKLKERLDVVADAVKAFCLSGINFAMTNYNNK